MNDAKSGSADSGARGPVVARSLAPPNLSGLAAELEGLGIDPGQAARIARHAAGQALRLEGVADTVAAELAARLRSLGGEAVVGPSLYSGNGSPPGSVDVVLLGSAAQLWALDADLNSTECGPDRAAADGLPPTARQTSLTKPRHRPTPREKHQNSAASEAIRHAMAAAEWQPGVLRLGTYRLDLARRVAVMGIINATPDSFFRGGRFTSAEAAVEHGLRLVTEGADLLDVGGDSAGGSARRIDAAEEIRRVEPVIRGLAAQARVPIAVDTYRAATAAAALDAGAAMVNDISGLGDPAMAATVAHGDAGLCVMHIKGMPKEFPPDFHYDSLLGDMLWFLGERTGRALAAGIERDRLVVDPGIEFGKLLHQDLEILRRLPELHVLGYPVLVAVSRKDFIGNILGLPPEERLEGTAAAVAFSIFRGARIVRVHDVREMTRVARVAEALVGYTFGDDSQGRRRSDGALV